MPRRFTIIAAVAAVTVFAAAGCSGNRDGDDDPSPEPPPDAAQLLAAAADEMAGVETVRLQIETDADLANLPVRGADAVVTRSGEAQGTAEIEQFGQLVELRFVMVDDAFHYQLVGAWLQMPRAEAAQLYDPSAILDPDRGVANLLRNANDPQMQGRTTVAGVDTYEVTATFSATDLTTMLPGVPDGVPGTVWIGVDRPLLHRAEFTLPGGTATATLSEFDAPVDIVAP